MVTRGVVFGRHPSPRLGRSPVGIRTNRHPLRVLARVVEYDGRMERYHQSGDWLMVGVAIGLIVGGLLAWVLS